MKKTSEATTVVNKIIGKTISEMSWEEIRKISKPINRNLAINQFKSV